MNFDNLDIDWGYLIERLEHLLDLGEEYLSRKLAVFELDPEVLQQVLAFRWRDTEAGGLLEQITHPDVPARQDLVGIDATLEPLYRNTRQFVAGVPSNHVLLWGERGTGKSTAVKSLLGEFGPQGLRLVEIHKEDLYLLPEISAWLRPLPYRFVLVCDDLSFSEPDVSYRELKSLLEGGLEACPDNLRIYATSNRRHLLPERMSDNTGEAEIHPEEAVSEKLSLADRFGLALGFYPPSQSEYLAIVHHWAARHELSLPAAKLEQAALLWARQRGARSGRVARQFIDDLSGQLALQGQI